MKKKYQENEEYKEKKNIMEQKKEDYDQVKNKLKSCENSYKIREEKFDNKLQEIQNIIKTIETNKITYPKRSEDNITLSKKLDSMYQTNKEKTNKRRK